MNNTQIIQESHLITLNSIDAIQNNGSMISNVYFNFVGLLKPEKNILYNEVQFYKAEIPFSFFTINNSNNTLSYFLSSNKTIVIPNGNYNANTFITQLMTSFSNNGDNFVISINNSNGILTFSNTVSFVFYTSIIMTTLGFQNQTYNSSGNTIIAPFPLNLLGIKRLSIKSIELMTNNYSSSNSGLDSVLGVVSVDVPNFNLITYSNSSGISHKLRNKFINKIDIQILDENNNFIDFNNIHWSINLLLTTYRIINNDVLLLGELK